MENQSILNVTESNFQEEVLNQSGAVLVDFWAEGCGPCRSLEPFLDDLVEKSAGKLRVAKANIEENQESLVQYGVRGIPTVILFQGGEKKELILGANFNKIKTAVQGIL